MSGVPIAVPAAKSQLLPAQYRNSTWATPESASVDVAETACPFWIVAPAGGCRDRHTRPGAVGGDSEGAAGGHARPVGGGDGFAPEALAPALQL